MWDVEGAIADVPMIGGKLLGSLDGLGVVGRPTKPAKQSSQSTSIQPNLLSLSTLSATGADLSICQS